MSAPDDFMRDINAQKLSAPLLGKVMPLGASLPPDEWNDFDRNLERVVDLVGKEHCGDDGPMLAMTAALRLMALDALVFDPEFRGGLITEHSPDGILTFTAIYCGLRRSRQSSEDRTANPCSTGVHSVQAWWN